VLKEVVLMVEMGQLSQKIVLQLHLDKCLIYTLVEWELKELILEAGMGVVLVTIQRVQQLIDRGEVVEPPIFELEERLLQIE
jgi:hypothetical protein